jgi:hypothetical protein
LINLETILFLATVWDSEVREREGERKVKKGRTRCIEGGRLFACVLPPPGNMARSELIPSPPFVRIKGLPPPLPLSLTCLFTPQRYVSKGEFLSSPTRRARIMQIDEFLLLANYSIS